MFSCSRFVIIFYYNNYYYTFPFLSACWPFVIWKLFTIKAHNCQQKAATSRISNSMTSASPPLVPAFLHFLSSGLKRRCFFHISLSASLPAFFTGRRCFLVSAKWSIWEEVSLHFNSFHVVLVAAGFLFTACLSPEWTSDPIYLCADAVRFKPIWSHTTDFESGRMSNA